MAGGFVYITKDSDGSIEYWRKKPLKRRYGRDVWFDGGTEMPCSGNPNLGCISNKILAILPVGLNLRPGGCKRVRLTEEAAQ